MNRIDKEALERVARIYKSNKEASQVIRVHPRSFARMCREHPSHRRPERGHLNLPVRQVNS